MYAENEIDPEKLAPENFSKASERAQLMHLDPVAVAKYFNTIIQAIINILIGCNKKNNGIFEAVKNYYSVVEYQDHGTPHCHMLIWLHDALDLILLCQKLKNDNEFWHYLLNYISNIVREDINYLCKKGELITNKMVKAECLTPKTILEKQMHFSFLPIPDPRLPDFKKKFCLDLLTICKRTLFHYCTKACKKFNRDLQKHCRFDFPRELVDPPDIIFPEQRVIAIQHISAYFNNHNSYITTACRGNNDIKFISTQKLALACIHYITDYITKLDISTYSSFLICASILETFLDQLSNNDSYNLIDKSLKLITKYLNKMTGQTELTSPQVSAYLLDIDDHYTSNKFVNIYLQTFKSHLMKE
ncbi:141_t:CDS:1 [Cetraspora pellucida]|uniref:141_t:CDS:1 n=1 Tax=Cetraspora pellucida TaxID=1433469 RepID=A0A9N9IFK4_9GLOM|nr:141_t:CDS:1 [Cetraspora pellucida]